MKTLWACSYLLAIVLVSARHIKTEDVVIALDCGTDQTYKSFDDIIYQPVSRYIHQIQFFHWYICDLCRYWVSGFWIVTSFLLNVKTGYLIFAELESCWLLTELSNHEKDDQIHWRLGALQDRATRWWFLRLLVANTREWNIHTRS
jgi:hypothetical protein